MMHTKLSNKLPIPFQILNLDCITCGQVFGSLQNMYNLRWALLMKVTGSPQYMKNVEEILLNVRNRIDHSDQTLPRMQWSGEIKCALSTKELDKIRENLQLPIPTKQHNSNIRDYGEPGEICEIDHVIRYNIQYKQKWALVRWKGYSAALDSWVKDEEITKPLPTPARKRKRIHRSQQNEKSTKRRYNTRFSS